MGCVYCGVFGVYNYCFFFNCYWCVVFWEFVGFYEVDFCEEFVG